MDELVGLVSAKTGLSEETAREVVDIVIGYLKDKLPAPIAGQIDGLLAGTGSMDDLGDLTKGLGGLLGNQ